MERPPDTPAISVVMPVYNAETYLAAAIRSILDQSLKDIELVIVDDGSTDGSAAVIASFADPRLRCIRQENRGIANALDRGIAEARAPWIARQDADDIALPQRLEEQLRFLRAHPEVGLLGTWATTIAQDGTPTGVLEHRTDHESIRYLLLFDSPFVHPSVIFRKDLYLQAGGYDPDPAIFEDLDLWYRMVRITRTANLPMHLVRYRDVPTGLTRSTTRGRERLKECRRRNLRHRFPHLPANEREAMLNMRFDHPRISTATLRAVHARLDDLLVREVTSAEVRKALRKDLHVRLMDFRVIPHRTLLHRALDKAWKSIVLALGPGPITTDPS